MPTIFINYRRDDTSGYAGRVHDNLVAVFGRQSVFMDLSDIAPGVNFASTIDAGVARCDVMLVLLGRRWLDRIAGGEMRRLDDPADLVRIEIEKGFARGVRVIPVLVDGATMPAARDLPPSIGKLAELQAIALTNERWDYDIGHLIGAMGGPPAQRAGAGASRWLLMIAAAVVVIVAIAVAAVILRPAPASDPGAAGSDTGNPRGTNPGGQSQPWSAAQAVLTLTDGKVVELRAETLCNCISVSHELTMEDGQSVEFQALKRIDVVRADRWLTPNAKAALHLTLLNGMTIDGTVTAGCDLFGYNDTGRFMTYFESLRSIEFRR